MRRFTRLLAALVVVAGLLAGVWVPGKRALAADLSSTATTTLSSQFVNVGSIVALGGIGGAGGWAPGEAVTIYLASTNGQRDWSNLAGAGEAVATAVADAIGFWSASFTMPDRAGAMGTVNNGIEMYVVGPTNQALFSTRGPAAVIGEPGVPDATTLALVAIPRTNFPTTPGIWTAGGFGKARAFVVQPFMSRSASSGGPGTRVTINGSGFAANETGITVNFGDAATGGGPFIKTVASGITATSRGAWSATFSAPDAAAARYNLIVNPGAATTPPVGGTTPRPGITGQFAPFSFEIIRTLRLFPDRASPGAALTVLARGFAASSSIAFAYDGALLATNPASTVSTADGRVLATFIVPASAPFGPHKVSATDGSGGVATAQLTVVRATSITITPNKGSPGDAIAITGSGFNPLALMDFALGGTALLATPPAIITGADGSFTASLKLMEPKAPGYYSLVVTDMFGESASAIYAIRTP